MLRIQFLQQWYASSDLSMEVALHDTPKMQPFAGVNRLDEVPDETTIINFRLLLQARALAAPRFERVQRGSGPQVPARSPTNNRSGTREPEMHQVKKGNPWYFGMKAYLGVDDESGLVHQVECTAANLDDVTCCMAKKAPCLATAAYTSADKRKELEAVRGS
ncbi:MAG: transposase [Pseudoxanthomonas sp.]